MMDRNKKMSRLPIRPKGAIAAKTSRARSTPRTDGGGSAAFASIALRDAALDVTPPEKRDDESTSVVSLVVVILYVSEAGMPRIFLRDDVFLDRLVLNGSAWEMERFMDLTEVAAAEGVFLRSGVYRFITDSAVRVDWPERTPSDAVVVFGTATGDKNPPTDPPMGEIPSRFGHVTSSVWRDHWNTVKITAGA